MRLKSPICDPVLCTAFVLGNLENKQFNAGDVIDSVAALKEDFKGDTVVKSVTAECKEKVEPGALEAAALLDISQVSLRVTKAPPKSVTSKPGGSSSSGLQPPSGSLPTNISSLRLNRTGEVSGLTPSLPLGCSTPLGSEVRLLSYPAPADIGGFQKTKLMEKTRKSFGLWGSALAPGVEYPGHRVRFETGHPGGFWLNVDQEARNQFHMKVEASVKGSAPVEVSMLRVGGLVVCR